MKRTSWLGMRFLLMVALLTAFHLPTKSEILDPWVHHPILREIADTLDHEGIDVVQDWRSEVRTTPRPILAPLFRYPVSASWNSAEFKWIEGFDKGAMGAVMAFKPTGKIKHDTFRKQWYDVPPERRVFISFTRENAEEAEIVRIALEAKGYITFTYIKHIDEDPRHSPTSVGEYFITAGTNLVIDTEEARESKGVLAELLVLQKYRRTYVTKGDIVKVYGAQRRCPRTREAIRRYSQAGATLIYHDIDLEPDARRVVAENRRWLVENKYLPFVLVNGKPVRFRSKGLKEASSIFTQNPQEPQSCTDRP